MFRRCTGFVFFLVVINLTLSCRSKAIKPLSTDNSTVKYLKQYFVPVTVVDYKNLDGCEYLLVKENGEKLQAVNLADSLKKDQLKLWIRYVPEKGMGICMAGEMIRLADCKPYEKNK